MAQQHSAAGEVHLSDHSLGPTMREWWGVCFEAEPTKIKLVLCSAFFCLAVTLFLWYRHCAVLKSTPSSLRKTYYLRICFMPVAFGVGGFLALLSPSSYSFAIVVTKMYEAYVLYSFGLLMFVLLVHESRKYCKGHDINVACVADATTKALAAHGKRKHYGAPPLGCFCRPFLKEHDMSAKDINRVFSFLQQYVCLLPTVGLAMIYAVTAVSTEEYFKLQKIAKLVMGLSVLICLYGLFMLYIATKDVLHDWNTTRKFVAIKLFLIVLVCVEPIVERVAAAVLHKRGSCFSELGFRKEWSSVEARWWTNWLISLFSVAMMLILRRAFPAYELQEKFVEEHADLLRNAAEAYAHDESASSDEEVECPSAPDTVHV